MPLLPNEKCIEKDLDTGWTLYRSQIPPSTILHLSVSNFNKCLLLFAPFLAYVSKWYNECYSRMQQDSIWVGGSWNSIKVWYAGLLTRNKAGFVLFKKYSHSSYFMSHPWVLVLYNCRHQWTSLCSFWYKVLFLLSPVTVLKVFRFFISQPFI